MATVLCHMCWCLLSLMIMYICLLLNTITNVHASSLLPFYSVPASIQSDPCYDESGQYSYLFVCFLMSYFTSVSHLVSHSICLFAGFISYKKKTLKPFISITFLYFY